MGCDVWVVDAVIVARLAQGVEFNAFAGGAGRDRSTRPSPSPLAYDAVPPLKSQHGLRVFAAEGWKTKVQVSRREPVAVRCTATTDLPAFCLKRSAVRCPLNRRRLMLDPACVCTRL